MFNALVVDEIISKLDDEFTEGDLSGSVLFSKTLLNSIGSLYNKSKSRSGLVAEGTVTLWDIIEKYVPSITNDCNNEMGGAKAKYLLHLIVKLYMDYYKHNPSYIKSKELISEDARKYVESEDPNCELFKQMCLKTRWDTISIDVYLGFVIERWDKKTTKKFGSPIKPTNSQNRAKVLCKFGVPIIIPSLRDSYETNLENWIDKDGKPHKEAEGKKGKYQGEEQKQLKHDLICALENEYHCFTKNILGQKIPLEQTLKLIANFRYEAHSNSEATMLYMRSLEDVAFVSAVVQRIPLPYNQYSENIESLQEAYFNTIVNDAKRIIESSYANIRSVFLNLKVESVKKGIKMPFPKKTLNKIEKICGENVVQKRINSFYNEITKIVQESVLDVGAFCESYVSKLQSAKSPALLLEDMYKEVFIPKDKMLVKCNQFIEDIFEMSESHGLKFNPTAKDDIANKMMERTTSFCLCIIEKAVSYVVDVQKTGLDNNNTITFTVTQELCDKLECIQDIEKYVKDHVYYFDCLKHRSIYNAVAQYTSLFFERYLYVSGTEENAEMRLFNYMRDLIHNTFAFSHPGEAIEVYANQKYTDSIKSKYNSCIDIIEALQRSLGFVLGTPRTFKDQVDQTRDYKHKFDAKKINMSTIRNLLIAFCFETSDTITIKQINGILEDCGFAPLYTKYDAIKSKPFDWLVVQAVVLCSNRTIKKKVCEEMLELNEYYLSVAQGDGICI